MLPHPTSNRAKRTYIFFLMAFFGFVYPVLATPEFDGPTKSATLKKNLVNPNKKMTVSFRNADIKDILRFFSTDMKINIILAPEVKGLVSFDFDSINPVDALDSILSSQGYDWHEDNGVIYVYTQQPATVVKLNYGKAQDVMDSVGKMVSQRGMISMNESTNSLIIRAPQSDLKRILKLVKELDTVPLQVLVEVRILELQADKSETLGISPSLIQPNGQTLQTNGLASPYSADGASGIFVQVSHKDLKVLMEALEKKTGVDLLATPKILALNHKPASIITGQRLGYKTNSTSSTGTLITESVQFLEVGTKLTFTPHISDNGDILMEIKPEVSEGVVADGIPNESTTETSTSVMVRDGQTILISGLIRKKNTQVDTGVPFLSSIPLIDRFFKRTENIIEKKETVVLITPHLVTPDKASELEKEYGGMHSLQDRKP